jgi:hypothetical protein
MERGAYVVRLKLVLGGCEVASCVHTAVVAGWTGRDRVALEEHIAELEALGVARPSTTPIFYRVSASRLTTALEIESTANSSGEVEAVLLRHDGRLWVGVGSDHTDRQLESYSVAVSKQLCDKPIAVELWSYEEVESHWDRLILRSWITEDGIEVPYQEGSLDGLLPSDELLARAHPPLTDGTLMFCGTCSAQGGIRPTTAFRYELEDPILGRTIAGRYVMRTLPLIS